MSPGNIVAAEVGLSRLNREVTKRLATLTRTKIQKKGCRKTRAFSVESGPAVESIDTIYMSGKTALS